MIKYKYRTMVKILKVFKSCETYYQWNNAREWYDRIAPN